MADPRYRALLIGNASFPRAPHALLTLRGPLVDIERVGRVLTDGDVGLFSPRNVVTLPDKGVQELREQVEGFFSTARPEDVLLLYYSGHGELDTYNKLYLCANDTTPQRLVATALSAAEISMMIDRSAAGTTIIILDCCHGAAFKTGSNPLTASVAGRGRYVLASSRSTQLARDAEIDGQPSPFTSMLVRGLQHAEGRGNLTVGELYRQVHHWITAESPQPPHLTFDGEGDVVIARRRAPHPPHHTSRLSPGSGRAHRTERPGSTGRLPDQAPGARPLAVPLDSSPRAPGPVELSWTGKEPLSEYADVESRSRLRSPVLRRWSSALPVIVSAVIVTPIWLIAFIWVMTADDSKLGGHPVLTRGAYLAAVYLVGFMALMNCALAYREWRKIPKPVWWTLSIGPHYIATTTINGRREFYWESIERIAIEPIESSGPHHYNGLHIKNVPMANRPKLNAPAGWPVAQEPPSSRHSSLFPVCVLGPLTEQERVALFSALSRYGGRRWKKPWP
ncbi:caspase family protein [Streptomyces sp. C10-9-1]|uniref:caspase family protein n=1 Tax=Streptomyces sp. C10-9-1 TaxID=1859285 RepID=UPI0021123AC6|nr:caspase family protein [Streptomyces sp. C10-9-1]MCQ6551967.1 caspase family protein [Streptomyces sp. C10-9-1]